MDLISSLFASVIDDDSIDIQCNQYGDLYYVSSSVPIIGRGKDKEICDVILRHQSNFRIYLYDQGQTVVGYGSKTRCSDYILTYGHISPELHPVANNIQMFKKVDVHTKQHYNCVYIDQECNIRDITKLHTNAIVISKNCIIHDLSEMDETYKKLCVYYEQKSLCEIINNFTTNGCRNMFIDQLIESGYEDWL